MRDVCILSLFTTRAQLCATIYIYAECANNSRRAHHTQDTRCATYVYPTVLSQRTALTQQPDVRIATRRTHHTIFHWRTLCILQHAQRSIGFGCIELLSHAECYCSIIYSLSIIHPNMNGFSTIQITAG